MGCSGPSRLKLEGMDMPLDSNFERFDIEELDSYFKPQKEVIQGIENSREHYCDMREELMILSGACVYKSNAFENIYLGYLVNCELEVPGFIKRIKVQDEPPYFIHKESFVRNRRLNKLLTEYCSIMISGKLQWESVRFADNLEAVLIDKVAENDSLIVERKKLQKNFALIAQADTVSKILDSYINELDIVRIKINGKLVEKVMSYVEKARKMNVVQPCEVIWINLNNEEKCGNCATYNRNILEEKLKEKIKIKENIRRKIKIG
jgi:hypothetical protein